MAAICVWATLAGAPTRAFAEDGEWLLVPSAVAAEAEAEASPISRRAAQQLARVLGGGSPRLLAPDRARNSFEQRGSTAPLLVSHSDLDALARDTQMALYHVASGLTGRARADVERALARADKVLESLNRESLAAQQLLDACLYLVRAHLADKERQAAREQALECRRLVPDVEPDGTMHPPDVIGILAEAEAELRLREPGSLRVESEPEGCAVFVNGRHLGEAPLELPQLSPGVYRVQAECDEGRTGRVHRVTIGSTRVVTHIDTGFDSAVQTSLDVSLHYSSAEAQRTRAYADAVEVGRVVGVSDVLVVLPVFDASGSATDKVQVDRIRVSDGALTAVVRLRVDAAGAIESTALTAAARDLRKAGRGDYSGPTPTGIDDVYAVALAMPEPKAAPNASAALGATRSAVKALDVEATPAAAIEPVDKPDASWKPSTLGAVVGITGGVAILAGWGVFARQLSLEATYSDQKAAGADPTEFRKTLADLRATELAPMIVGGAGAALLTVSLPWLLPPAPGVPVWGIVAGSFGGAMAIVGTVFLIRGAQCDSFDVNTRCTDILATTRLGGVLLVGALPWLSVPLVYLVRGLGKPRATDDVSLAPTADGRGAQLIWRGKL